MPRTIQCPDCGVVLNVPEAAAGRRLKCPKCGNKFAADGAPTPPAPPPSPSASRPPTPRRDPSSGSTLLLSASSGGHGDADLPTASGSLREQFDLPLLGEDTPSSRGSGGGEADPIGLLRDDSPVSRRKPLPGDARARDRRCPTCGSVVPRGMSLCGTCGLDLDTGTRVDIVEDIETVAGPRRSSGPPIGVVIVGGLSISTALIFSIISLLQWRKGETGYIFLLLVCLFGIGAAVQFLRSKTTRLLLVALSLGALIDVAAMIILPVYDAVSQVDVRDQAPASDDVDVSDTAIVNVSERLDTNRISWGIAILISYAAVSVYLNSPPVKRHFRR